MKKYRVWYKTYDPEMDEWDTGEMHGNFESIYEALKSFTTDILALHKLAEIVSVRAYGPDGHFEDEQ